MRTSYGFEQLRHRRFDHSSRLLKRAELCLDEFGRQRAVASSALCRGPHSRERYHERPRPAAARYMVLDLEWRKDDEYSYLVHETRQVGRLYRGRQECKEFCVCELCVIL